ILAVVYVLGAIMTPPEGIAQGKARSDRQLIGTVVVGAYIVLVAACFAYFYPIFTAQVIPYESWSGRMWLGGRWI
ncbi:MAG: phospholipid carrier-dependent glycosyltransferase, partial [Actinomycetota bacterium]|nr:phospholipid carrier-dependent glycosyltransferase [Actinomycetota bacterium]